MTEPLQNHWTDDEELLDQYVLGRLPADRKRAFDLHLEVCEQCRAAAASRGMLISGIRRYGRQEIKSRLAIRVGQYHQTRLNWYRYAGIAAAIVLFFAVGFEGDWFFGRERYRGYWHEQTDSLRRITRPERRDGHRPSEELAGNAPKNESKEMKKRAASPARGAVSEKDKLRSDKPNSLGDVAAVTAPSEQDIRLLSTSAEGRDTVSFRLEGAFVSGSPEKASGSGGKAVSAFSQEPKARVKGLARISQPTRAQDSETGPEQLTLVQRLVSELPGSPEPTRNKRGAIPAQLKIVGPKTQLILFLDSLFTPSQFSAATVEIVRPDSIVLNIGGRRIGFRVPPGILNK